MMLGNEPGYYLAHRFGAQLALLVPGQVRTGKVAKLDSGKFNYWKQRLMLELTLKITLHGRYSAFLAVIILIINKYNRVIF